MANWPSNTHKIRCRTYLQHIYGFMIKKIHNVTITRMYSMHCFCYIPCFFLWWTLNSKVWLHLLRFYSTDMDYIGPSENMVNISHMPPPPPSPAFALKTNVADKQMFPSVLPVRREECNGWENQHNVLVLTPNLESDIRINICFNGQT